MKFVFKTTATMKPYNSKKWWIDGNCVGEKIINADNTLAALNKYRELVYDKDCITISDNALKNREPMYDTIDGETVQVGYVLTGRTTFYDNDGNPSEQYIELWVAMALISRPTFYEEVLCNEDAVRGSGTK